MKYFYFTLILILSTAVIFSPKFWDNTYLKIAKELKNNPQGVTNKQKEDIQEMFRKNQNHTYHETIRLGGFMCMYYILEEEKPHLACAWLDSAEQEYGKVKDKVYEKGYQQLIGTRTNDISFLSKKYVRKITYRMIISKSGKQKQISTTDYLIELQKECDELPQFDKTTFFEELRRKMSKYESISPTETIYIDKLLNSRLDIKYSKLLKYAKIYDIWSSDTENCKTIISTKFPTTSEISFYTDNSIVSDIRTYFTQPYNSLVNVDEVLEVFKDKHMKCLEEVRDNKGTSYTITVESIKKIGEALDEATEGKVTTLKPKYNSKTKILTYELEMDADKWFGIKSSHISTPTVDDFYKKLALIYIKNAAVNNNWNLKELSYTIVGISDPSGYDNPCVFNDMTLPTQAETLTYKYNGQTINKSVIRGMRGEIKDCNEILALLRAYNFHVIMKKQLQQQASNNKVKIPKDIKCNFEVETNEIEGGEGDTRLRAIKITFSQKNPFVKIYANNGLTSEEKDYIDAVIEHTLNQESE